MRYRRTCPFQTIRQPPNSPLAVHGQESWFTKPKPTAQPNCDVFNGETTPCGPLGDIPQEKPLTKTHAGPSEIPRAAGPAGAPSIPPLKNSGSIGRSGTIMEGHRSGRAAVPSSAPVELWSFDCLPYQEKLSHIRNGPTHARGSALPTATSSVTPTPTVDMSDAILA